MLSKHIVKIAFVEEINKRKAAKWFLVEIFTASVDMVEFSLAVVL